MRTVVLRHVAGLGLAGLGLVSTAGAGCAKKAPTALVVAVQSEAPIPKEIDAMEIEVQRGDSTPFFQQYVLGTTNPDARLPGTIALSKQDGESSSDPVTVIIRAQLGGQKRVVRMAKLGFSDEKTKLLKMPLRYSCLDFPSVCAPGQECLGGECRDVSVDVEKLPDYSDDLVFGSAATGGCFDESTDVCFTSARVLGTSLQAPAVDATCVLDTATSGTPSGSGGGLGGAGGAAGAGGSVGDKGTVAEGDGNKLNIALHWAKATDASQFNTLDFEPAAELAEGWTFVDGSTTKVRFATGICRAIQEGRVTSVRFASACSPKTIERPLCPQKAKEKTLEDSKCFTCQSEPSDCKPLLDKARSDKDSSAFVQCWVGSTFSGSFTKADDCPEAARTRCASTVSAECQANLNTPACKAKYGALLDLIACVDTVNGGLGDDAAGDREAAYQRCKSACDAEGFDKVCRTAPSEKTVSIPVGTGAYSDGAGHSLVATATQLSLTSDGGTATSLTIETYAPPTTSGNFVFYEAKVVSKTQKPGSGVASPWPTFLGDQGATGRFWLRSIEGGYFVDFTAPTATAPGSSLAGPFSTSAPVQQKVAPIPAGKYTSTKGHEVDVFADHVDMIQHFDGFDALIRAEVYAKATQSQPYFEAKVISVGGETNLMSWPTLHASASIPAGTPARFWATAIGGGYTLDFTATNATGPGNAAALAGVFSTSTQPVDPCAKGTTAQKTQYCSQQLGLPAGDLVTCVSSMKVSSTTCPAGTCVINGPTQNDACGGSVDSPCLIATQSKTQVCSSSVLYTCDPVTKQPTGAVPCPNGCVMNAGNDACAGAASCAPQPGGVIAWWKGDGNTSDVTGNHNGMGQPGLFFGPGEVGQGFDVSKGGATFSDAGFPSGISDRAVSLWFRASSPTGYFFGYGALGDVTSAGWGIGLDNGDVVVASAPAAPTASVVATPSKSVVDGAFHHLVAVGQGGLVRIYLDGIQIGAGEWALPTMPGGSGSIGSFGGVGITGIVDEVMVFSTALSQAQINAIFAAGSAGVCTAVP